jgi:hypothetical protein
MPALIEQGASQRRILIAGHSHAYALGLPGAKADAEPQVVAIAPGFDGLTGPWPRTNHYWDLLAEEAKSGSYFPSYEIITGPQAPFEYFEDDRRSVTKAGIDCVMQGFLANCETGQPVERPTPAPAPSAAKIVDAECEEEMVARS